MSDFSSPLPDVYENDRRSFAQVLARILSASGSFSFERKDLLAELDDAWSLGASGRDRMEEALANPGTASLQDLIAGFAGENTPYLLVQVLVLRAIDDGVYGDVQGGIAQLAERLELSNEQIQSIEAAAEQRKPWQPNSEARGGTEEFQGDTSGDSEHDYDLEDIPTNGSTLEDIGTESDDYDYH